MRGAFMLLAGLLGTSATVIAARQARTQRRSADASRTLKQVADEWKTQEAAAIRGWLLRAQRMLEDRVRAVVEDRRHVHEATIRALRTGGKQTDVRDDELRPAIASLEGRIGTLLDEVVHA